MKIIEKEFNVVTGEETITEREETAQEKAEREAYQLKIATLEAEAKAIAQARAEAEAKLAKLGLTADDLRALGL